MSANPPPSPAPRHRRWLDVAGIGDPGLRQAFELCRRLHADFGKTYYLATMLLPPAKRPYVNSLYGFARFTDEIIDNGDPATKGATLSAWTAQVEEDIRRGQSDEPVCQALLHTLRTWDIPLDHVDAFLRSMMMDIDITEYRTYQDLREYTYGSAAVMGLEMVPILGPLTPEAHDRASALGEAFQLTNFVRDIAEDLDRGRIYLPMEDLEAFGVTRESLESRVTTRRTRELLKFEIDRIRGIYAHAEGGIAMLEPSSRDCVRTAYLLYSGILDEVEKADYRVLDRRVAVGLRRRLGVGLPAYLRARRTWSDQGIPDRREPLRRS